MVHEPKAFLFRQLFFVPSKKNCPAQYKNKFRTNSFHIILCRTGTFKNFFLRYIWNIFCWNGYCGMYQCRCRTYYEKSGLRRYQPSAETENIERYTACRYCDNNGLQCAVSVCAMRISGGLGTGRPDRQRRWSLFAGCPWNRSEDENFDRTN